MIQRTKTYLALASGKVFQGWGFGSSPEAALTPASGEIVFNTSLSGYQEILTDPSYRGQIVAMTASHIGNYGVTPEDIESRKLFLSGFVVQELSSIYSNWRATEGLHGYLVKAGVAGMTGVDTRALTRYLRTQGAVNGLISTDGRNMDALVKKAKALPGLEGRDLTKEVTTSETYHWTLGSDEWTDPLIKKASAKRKVVVMDFGAKQNILRCLVDRNCDVTVVPATATAQQILDLNPDGVMVSNGPGDPAAIPYGVKSLEQIIAHTAAEKKKGNNGVAVFGICLGHQLLGLALGGTTFKLKFGHHGANHPVKDIETGRVDITTQNHGFAVAGEQLGNEWIVKGNKDALVTHINLNDNAVEGLRHKTLPVFSVQYHPEAAAGPHDPRHLFDRFIELMEKK